MRRNRREFLVLAGAAVVAGALPSPALAAGKTKHGGDPEDCGDAQLAGSSVPDAKVHPVEIPRRSR
jgi:hypothetical protein